MISQLVWALALLPFEITPSPSSFVHPPRSSGFAAAIVGGFFGLGILVLMAVFVSLKPRRARPPIGRHD